MSRYHQIPLRRVICARYMPSQRSKSSIPSQGIHRAGSEPCVFGKCPSRVRLINLVPHIYMCVYIHARNMHTAYHSGLRAGPVRTPVRTPVRVFHAGWFVRYPVHFGEKMFISANSAKKRTFSEKGRHFREFCENDVTLAMGRICRFSKR